MQDDGADLAVNLHIRQHHRLRRGIVPAIARRFLIMPFHAARLAVQRDDGGEVKIGAACGRATADRIRTAIAHADIDGVELGIIIDRIPNRAAAANVPAALRIPSLERVFQFRIFLRPAFGVARHGEEAPGLRPIAHAIGRHIAAHIIFRPGIADHHHIARHIGRAGDGVATVMIDNGIDRPKRLAGLGVERIQLAIKRPDENLATRHSDAAIGLIAASGAIGLHVHLWLEGPKRFAGGSIQRIDPAQIAAGVHHPIDDDGRRLLHAIGAKVIAPGQAQPADIAGLDIGQARKMAVMHIAAGESPVIARAIFRRGTARTGRHQRNPHQRGQATQRLDDRKHQTGHAA